jgi:hypothetical protein
MDPERWKEIERLCQAALEMEQGKREAWLNPMECTYVMLDKCTFSVCTRRRQS